ncbi:MAG: aminoglycoside phosphotransferase family protein [Candidatus Lokiarchaeota archaeon]|nr:aminoglycoside phosphotransferase family protein [Candidatus Lokiarchaeota archaeon]
MDKNNLIGEGRESEVFLWGNDQVLKLFRTEVTEERIDFEYKISELVQKYYPHAPKVFDKIHVNGRQGILYEFIDGNTLNENILEHILKIRTFGKCLGTLHAKMHKHNVDKIRLQKPYFEQRIRNTSFLTNIQKEIIIEYLYNLKDGDSLCHGDLHGDNVLISNKAPFVIDWSNLTIGNPHADIARTTYLLKKGTDPNASEHSFVYRAVARAFRSLFYRIYYKSYRKILEVSKDEINVWEIIICAVRLSENISEELDYLLKRINYNLKKLRMVKSS